jgi:hypothetical protein
VKAIWKALTLGVGICMACWGCGAGFSIVSLVSPSISQVSPQVIAAGTPSATLTVTGTNFDSKSAVVLNGQTFPTSVVNASTLAAQVSGTVLAQPTVAQLLVRSGSGVNSNALDVTVADDGQPQQPALAITTGSLPAGRVGSAYSATLAASGGTAGYAWSVSAGNLPAGLVLSSAGVLSGTPTGGGTSNFTVKVTDSGSPAQTQTVSFSMTVATIADDLSLLSVTSTSLSQGQVGASYALTLSASGGTPGYSWTMASGSLPAGLTLSSGGVISGTPTASGTFGFSVEVTDSGSPAQTQTVSLSLTISAAGATPLAITSSNLANGTSGASYSVMLSVAGGTPGYTWTMASGSLPAGLTLSSGGVISGTPTVSGTFNFSVKVTDSGSPAQTQTVSLALTISAPGAAPLAITSSNLANGTSGASYSATLSAAGGTPGYTWTMASGSLPAGVTLSSGGVISGTPTVNGTFNFSVEVTDSGSPVQTQTVNMSLTINVAAAQLVITTSTLSSGTSGASYSTTLSANGGTPGYAWSITSGSLPAGLSLGAISGVISGTPLGAGTSSFTIEVTDDGSPAQTKSATESIAISAGSPPPPPPPPGAPNLYLYPQAPVAPQGSYQTVTAVVTGTNDKTVSWTTDGGMIVGTNPCVVNEPCTVALYATNPGTYHLTATSNADNSLAATSTITITASPIPVLTHPRLGGITAEMLPTLQGKAVASNPLYVALYNRAVASYNSDNAIWSWSCNAGSGQPNSDQSENWKEGDGYLFAFMSMVDPNDATYKWGCYGRDIWMYYANFWLNPLSLSYSASTLAIRQVDANYGLTGNHGADSTEALTLTPDWLMAGGYLSAADQATTRAYFALAGEQMISIAYTGARALVGNYNSPTQMAKGTVWDFVGQRSMGNNYTHSKIMFLTAAALTFNDTPSDDPALTNTCGASRYTVCPDGSAGSLHAYWKYLVGGMLYKDWAHMEDPSVTLPAYESAYSNMSSMPTCEDSTSGTQVACMGDGRGGESSEGSWYQYSMYRLQLALVSIQSAGYDDPVLYGPQMSLATSSWWDIKAVSDLEFLTYSYYTPQPRIAFLSTGDTLNLFRVPSDFNAQAWMMVGDSDDGRSDRTAALEWPLLNTSVGGISAFAANLGNGYGSDNAIPLFLALPAGDPTKTPPADPRPSLPTDLYNGGNQHILVRSGWDAGGTESASWGNGGNNILFSLYCANTRIDHEHETCGGFDVLSDGEYITKTRTVFNDYNMMLATAEHSNEAGYGVDSNPAPCAVAGGCFEWQAVLGSDGDGGGQLWHGYQAGTATLAHAELPGYVAAIVDTTSLYNGSAAVGWGGIRGVTAASRSLIYLRGSNQIVYYDRGAGAANRKRLWATTTGPITISGSTASWPTRSGKQLAYLTSLLPAAASVSDAGAYKTNENGAPGTSDWEPYSHVMIDAGSPASTQFLTVMEWGGSGFAKSSTVLVESSSGQNFDGAEVGSTLVMFMRDWPSTFGGVTYPASGATTDYVSDLTPKTTYSISGNGTPASATTDDAGVLTFSAAGTGNITVSN